MKKNFFLILCVFLIFYVPVHGARKYQIKQKFSWYDDSRLVAKITEDGELIGWNFKSSTEFTLFRYRDGQYQLSSFSSKQGTNKSLPLDVAYNTLGQVAFTIATSASGFWGTTFDTQLAFWNRGQEPTIIGKPEGWNRFKVIALTDKGQILIQRLDYLPIDSPKARIAFWNDWKFTLIPSSFMSEAIAFIDDFVYGNDIRKNYIFPRVFNAKTEEAKNLEFPADTALTFVDEQKCIFGAIMDIDIESIENTPIRGVYKLNGSTYSFLPDNFIPLSSKERGKVIGMISKEIYLLNLETNELLSINDNIIDENGVAITFTNPSFVSVNSKGEMILTDNEFRLRALGRKQVSYVLSPIEIP